MLISVNTNEHRIAIPIPSRMVFNRLGAYLLWKFISPRDERLSEINYPQACKIINAINKSRHVLKGMDLINVDSANGDKVRIRL